jgi:serine/threonine-protein kinase
MEPAPETLGQFRISSLLGQGGSGTVYAARDADRPVALKVLRADLELVPREVKRFLAEAERLARVAHPHVVRPLGSGCLPDGRPYLVMPLLEGVTLARRLAEGPLPRPLALRLFAQLAGAVGALHAAGLLHRDLKPENVMLVAPDRLVLLDFGIAREADAPPSTTSRAGVIRGTPAYMAPEIFFGGPATVASDVYQLGVVLYQMLSGELPWPADNPADAAARLSPRPPPGVPPALAREVLRAMATVPESRPASADGFAASVAAAAAGPEETPRSTLPLAPAITPHDTPRPAAPRRARAALVAALAVAAVAAGATWLAGSGRPVGPPRPDAPTPRVAVVPAVDGALPAAPASTAATALAPAPPAAAGPPAAVAAAPAPRGPSTPPRAPAASRPAPAASGPPVVAPTAGQAPAAAVAPSAARASQLDCAERLVRLHCDTDYAIVHPDRCSWYRHKLDETRAADPNEQTRREIVCLENFGRITATAQIELRRHFRGRQPPGFKDDAECVRKVRDLACSAEYQAIERTSCADWTRRATDLARMSAKDRSATAHMCRLDYNGLVDQVAHALRSRAGGGKAP